jgi:hypothetical protein
VSSPPPPAPSLPPPPADGSPRYFALLYSPLAVRALLGTLLALADEISAGVGRGLDHSVAHLRLEWWRGEAERYAHGQPQHPWLRALLAHDRARHLNLRPLVEAAAQDLATETLGAQPGAALQRAVFELAESALRTPPDSEPPAMQLQRTLSELAERACELERFAAARTLPASAAAAPCAPSAAPPALAALRRQAQTIESALQPRLAPLLVWIALAARQAERRARRPARNRGTRLDGFADNIVAWKAARRAARGRFRID